MASRAVSAGSRPWCSCKTACLHNPDPLGIFLSKADGWLLVVAEQRNKVILTCLVGVSRS